MNFRDISISLQLEIFIKSTRLAIITETLLYPVVYVCIGTFARFIRHKQYLLHAALDQKQHSQRVNIETKRKTICILGANPVESWHREIFEDETSRCVIFNV